MRTGDVFSKEFNFDRELFVTRKYKGKFHFLEADFLKTEEVEKLGQDVLSIYPDGVDILVNNAGN